MAGDLSLDRYRHVSRLGSGGVSTVCLAEDSVLGRQVALKRMYAPDEAARSRLRREALLGASLTHPNLVSIFDVVTTEDGEEVIVMEYVEGQTLAQVLRGGARLDVATALEVLGGVSAALDAIHAQGIVHRDVKPDNILLGVDAMVKLADLGIAAVPERAAITTTGTVLGTVCYMAPEHLGGAIVTPAVDIYAMAAVAFEAFSGVRARREPNILAIAHAIATQPPPDLRSVWPQAPAAAAEVLMQGMSRDPRVRPRSAGELTARLRAAFEPPAVVPAAPPLPSQPGHQAPARATSRSRRGRGGFLAAAASLLTAGAVAPMVLAHAPGSRQRPPRQETLLANHSVLHSSFDHPGRRVPTAPGRRVPTAPRHRLPTTPRRRLPTTNPSRSATAGFRTAAAPPRGLAPPQRRRTAPGTAPAQLTDAKPAPPRPAGWSTTWRSAAGKQP